MVHCLRSAGHTRPLTPDLGKMKNPKKERTETILSADSDATFVVSLSLPFVAVPNVWANEKIGN